MDLTRFEQVVAAAMDDLPEWIRERLDNVEILVEDHPPPGQDLLGLYEGVPLTERGGNYTWTLPDRITLYRLPLERAARGNDDVLRRVVRDTVVHEVAHFFGITDERLRELGRG
jgi:predicted Zn-dependent protease with MMP-like domain